MSFDGIKGFKIVIEKDGYNESVHGTKKFRLYLEGNLLESFDYYHQLKERLIQITDAMFGEVKKEK